MKHFLFIVPEGRLLPLQFADAIPVLASDNSFSGYRTETSLASGLPLWEVSTAVLALFACFLLYLFFRQKKRAVLQRYRSAEQLRLIRCLLDLCYTYRESPAVFLDKFKDKVNIRELKSYTLIDAPKKRFPPVPPSRSAREGDFICSTVPAVAARRGSAGARRSCYCPSRAGLSAIYNRRYANNYCHIYNNLLYI